MLIVGAGGHALELLQCLEKLVVSEEFVFYDDVTPNKAASLLGSFPILSNEQEAIEFFLRDNRFALGLGGSAIRFALTQKFQGLGGQLVSVIAPSANVGAFDVILEPGLNIMHNAFISNATKIGQGSLINVGAGVHHNTILGRYCILSPGAKVLGRCQIDDFCHIGANATVLPDVHVGAYATVGAGAVVTRDVAPNTTVVGIPARPTSLNSHS